MQIYVIMDLYECACVVNSDLQKEFETIMKSVVGIDSPPR